MTPNFVADVVLLPVCCHIGSGMPNLRIFVEGIVTLLGAMTNLGEKTCLSSELETKQ